MAVQVAVLGLTRAGISAALALRARHNEIQCKGWDRDPHRLAAGERSRAFQGLSKHIKEIAPGAPVLLMDLPARDLQAALSGLKGNLSPEAVLVNLSALHVQPAQWAREALGGAAKFVSLLAAYHPHTLNEAGDDADEAREDLFARAVIYISAPADTDEAVLDLAADLVLMLGGLPVFADAAEVEGLAAANLLLPVLTSAALMAAVSRQPSWQDGRQLAGRALAQATAPLAEMSIGALAGEALANRQNTLRLLDDLTAAIRQMQATLQREDGAALENLLADGLDARLGWLKERTPQAEERGKGSGKTSESVQEKRALERFLSLGK